MDFPAVCGLFYHRLRGGAGDKSGGPALEGAGPGRVFVCGKALLRDRGRQHWGAAGLFQAVPAPGPGDGLRGDVQRV